jgi:hypothetical protein
MKQCPKCTRTYADDTLVYCLEDGGALVSHREPQETLRIPSPPRATDWPSGPTPTPTPGYQTNDNKSRWPIYALGGLVLLVLLAGAAGILIFGYARMTASIAASNDNQPGETKSESSPGRSPSPSPTPRSSAALVGAWRTSVVENGQAQEITVTFLPSGDTRYLFKDARGRTATDTGTWQYSDEVLFERFSSGASGKASIKWIDDNTVELTIIDNGVPSYIGVKRKYRRVS